MLSWHEDRKARLRESKVRLYVNADLRPGAAVAISPEQSHYLRGVMRLEAGQQICLFNGRDGEWRAGIEMQGRSGYSVRCEGQIARQRHESGPWLVFAPIKKGALDILVEKATELGVERLLPVITRFTVVERINLERLRAQAIEAAEQCGRQSIPSVAEPCPLDALLSTWPADRRLLFMDERRRGKPFAEVVLASIAAPPGPPGFLVGPEGGFSAEESEMLAVQPSVVAAHMGPRILRTETAAIAALACWQALAGDWRPTQPRIPGAQT
jgi:16S rRNA (uracil1498-N3)-methyltransferase